MSKFRERLMEAVICFVMLALLYAVFCGASLLIEDIKASGAKQRQREQLEIQKLKLEIEQLKALPK